MVMYANEVETKEMEKKYDFCTLSDKDHCNGYIKL